MKSLLLASKAVFIALIIFNSNAVAKSTPAEYIAMEDDIMMITSVSSSNGTISQIDIFDLSGNLVQTITGCGASQCTSNLSKLNSATYNVQVTTNTGYTLSDSVTVTSE